MYSLRERMKKSLSVKENVIVVHQKLIKRPRLLISFYLNPINYIWTKYTCFNFYYGKHEVWQHFFLILPWYSKVLGLILFWCLHPWSRCFTHICFPGLFEVMIIGRVLILIRPLDLTIYLDYTVNQYIKASQVDKIKVLISRFLMYRFLKYMLYCEQLFKGNKKYVL